MQPRALYVAAWVIAALAAVGCKDKETFVQREIRIYETKMSEEVRNRVQFANRFQQFLNDSGSNAFADTRSIPNQMWTGELHNVLIVKCFYCRREDQAEKYLTLANPEKLSELKFEMLAVGSTRGGDYLIYIVHNGNWLPGRRQFPSPGNQ
jgi:hypothetical protein